MLYKENVIFTTTLLLGYNFATGFDLDNDRNICENFNGTMPNTTLYPCPPAKFMTNEEFECYDKNYKKDMYENIFLNISCGKTWIFNFDLKIQVFTPEIFKN